jgi:hypothetical protein
VAKSPTRYLAAERLGITESSLSKVIRGLQEPGLRLLDLFGLERQTIYVKKHTPKPVVNSKVVDIEPNSDEKPIDVAQ